MKKNRISISQHYQTFELSPIQNQSDSFYKSVKLQFCSFVQPTTSSKLPPQQKWPKFNHDGLYYTPAFIIPQDINVLSVVKSNLKAEHIKNIKMNQQPSTKAFIPSLVIPNQKRQHHCGVCNTSYSLFEQHIASFQHKNNSLCSKYSKYISDFICQLFPSSFSINISQQCKKQEINPFIQQQDIQIKWYQNNQCFQQLQNISIQNHRYSKLTIQQTPIRKIRII